MEELTQKLRDMARCAGAALTGVATLETLEGGPPSTDLTYVLPTAKSALTFAVPMDEDLIEAYLRKEDHRGHEEDNIRTNLVSSGMSFEISNFLNQQGIATVPVAANGVYRADAETNPLDEKPPISHRYLAVRSGIGHFGYSGNVITKDYGASVILGSLVTEAELVPTDPRPPEENYCSQCKLCSESCVSGLMSPDEMTTVTMGGVEFSYSKRRHHNRCDYVCGGFSGLHQSGKWSTWSSARFPIPEKDEDFQGAIFKSLPAYLERISNKRGGLYHFLMPGNRLEFTCGHCQFMCHPDKEVRSRRYKALTHAGVVIEHPDGTRVAVTPEEAEAHLAAMSPEERARYEEVPETADMVK